VKLTLAAALGVAVLVATITLLAVSSAGGTPEGAGLAPSPAVPARPRVAPSVPACVLPGGRGPSAVPVTGVCTGHLRGTFACLARLHEELTLSIRRPIGHGRVFNLTIVIPEYIGPGGYPESEAFAQITGTAHVPRWTHRETLTRVDPAGFVELGRTVLTPEPGTPAAGRILVIGHAECGA
jgi:hypothetical protein